MLELFFSAFVTFFVIVDPPGCAPIYAGLTKGASAQQRRNMAVRACLIAGAILLVFALFGVDLLAALHIELHSFRIAGGLMLFWIAWEMVFEKRTQRREERAEKIAASPEVEDVSVFPMAMPMLAGPGAIAAIMLLMNEAQGIEQNLIVLGALVAVILITMAALIAAGPIMRLFGDKVEAAITRLPQRGHVVDIDAEAKSAGRHGHATALSVSYIAPDPDHISPKSKLPSSVAREIVVSLSGRMILRT